MDEETVAGLTGRIDAGEDGLVAGRGAVGLDIGTSGVRAAELTLGRDRATLQRFGQVDLPEGAMRDGEIVDPAAITAALQQLWSAVRFGSRKVVLGVANQRVVVRQVDLPWVPPKELRKALGYQVADVIPMPLEQAVLDVHPLEDFTMPDGRRMQRMLLVAAGREMVAGAMEAVVAAGLEPVGVDLTPFAILRSLGGGSALGLSLEADAIVDMGAEVTNVIVHQGGIPRFVRILPSGGADITDAMAERMGVDNATAEAVKLTLALPDGRHTEGDPIVRTLTAGATSWVDEVRGSLDYYVAQIGSLRLRRIVLTGGGAMLSGLPQLLATASRLPVVLGSPLSGMNIGKTRLSAEQLSFAEPRLAAPVGLALGAAA